MYENELIEIGCNPEDRRKLERVLTKDNMIVFLCLYDLLSKCDYTHEMLVNIAAIGEGVARILISFLLYDEPLKKLGLQCKDICDIGARRGGANAIGLIIAYYDEIAMKLSLSELKGCFYGKIYNANRESGRLMKQLAQSQAVYPSRQLPSVKQIVFPLNIEFTYACEILVHLGVLSAPDVESVGQSFQTLRNYGLYCRHIMIIAIDAGDAGLQRALFLAANRTPVSGIMHTVVMVQRSWKDYPQGVDIYGDRDEACAADCKCQEVGYKRKSVANTPAMIVSAEALPTLPKRTRRTPIVALHRYVFFPHPTQEQMQEPRTGLRLSAGAPEPVN